MNKPMKLGEVVPVTLVTAHDASNIKPAIEATTPAPAATEESAPESTPLPPAPVERPTPTPPPTVRTPPQPHPKVEPHPLAQAKPASSPTPKPVMPTKPAPAKAAQPSFDPDALLASLDKPSKAAGARRSAAARGPARPETAVQARLAPGAGSAVSASALADLGTELQRLWNPNCDVQGGADVQIKVSFQLGPGGRLMGAPEASGENSSDPVVKAASDRAKRAVFQGAPFDNLPQAAYGQRITVNFNAKQFCANR
jgi:protein TonB